MEQTVRITRGYIVMERNHGRLDLLIGRWPHFLRLAVAQSGWFYPSGRRWKFGYWNPEREPDC